ncbi:Pr6Pr family membrane protein [Demequina sp. NBRC 110056]|uniref:Pr6Pr family membrane protein n=1 Tax=Demequina sp. NBRC 110056 TaxID=1570345 RepID=UPI000A043CE3|nr:Pr6Pr family membrane protein [Demequina sp. NBRC 110056]
MSSAAATAVLRLIGAAAIVAALGVQAWADLTYGTFTWAELPGYFTPLAAVCAVAALTASALSGESEPRWVALLRVNAATYGIITGVVYWSLLSGVATPVFPWANLILHGGSGAILLLDLVLVGHASKLPVRTWWSVLAVPALWLGYLIARSQIDGWVPYPFLDPERGLVTVATTVAGIAGVGMIVAAALHGFLAAQRSLRASVTNREG